MGETREFKNYTEPDQIHLAEEEITSQKRGNLLEREGEIERSLCSADNGFNIVHGTDRAEDRGEERLNHFLPHVSVVYPASYAKRTADLHIFIVRLFVICGNQFFIE